jgi:hypothetical protein
MHLLMKRQHTLGPTVMLELEKYGLVWQELMALNVRGAGIILPKSDLLWITQHSVHVVIV